MTRLSAGNLLSLFRMAALSSSSALAFCGQWMSTSGSTIGTSWPRDHSRKLELLVHAAWMPLELACLITDRILVPKIRFLLALASSAARSGIGFIN